MPRYVAETVETLYAMAKSGDWLRLLARLVGDPGTAGLCSRYKSPSSGWTFLHQAAYSGQEDAARALIRLGASTTSSSPSREVPADVADKQGHTELGQLLRAAARSAEGLWEAPTDPSLLPSSSAWSEGVERRAACEMRVAYAGGVITIRQGSRHFVDSFDRTLIGWHGTYDPPSGMDDAALL